MDIPLLKDILIIILLAIGILYFFLRFRINTLIGFLLTGVLIGPHGFGLIEAVHEVEVMAEIGVVLLLFTIGIEFSLHHLMQIKKPALIGGTLQVLLTTWATFFILGRFGLSFGESLFIGFLISLSSTAIVLKILQEKNEVDSPHGRIILGILIFQDIIIVPMMLITPALAGVTGNLGGSILYMAAKGLGVITLVIVAAKWIVPSVLYYIVGTRSRELFLFGVLGICLGVAWLTSSIGLSLSLGAFLAGLTISESDYSHQALGNILPFQDIFSGFFFVSIGMLLDVRFFLEHSFFILLVLSGIILFKAILASLAAGVLGFPIRTTLLAGLALCQVGEFSFILARVGSQYGLLTGDRYQVFLAVSILSMAATPFIFSVATQLADLLAHLPLLNRIKIGYRGNRVIQETPLKDHLLIVGYGINGRNLARAARLGNIPYMILEMNPETVREEKNKGEPIFYGDATQEIVLEKTGLAQARVMVVVINDAAATRRIIEIARKINPEIYIIARTRFLQEVQALYELGADEVIPEEFETAVEIFTRLLKKYLFPKEEIERFTMEVRSDGYRMFRKPTWGSPSLRDLSLHIPDIEVSTFLIHRSSKADGKSLAELDLRRVYGLNVMAVRRQGVTVTDFDGNYKFQNGDLVVAMGSPSQLTQAKHLFSGLKEKETTL